MLLINIVNKFFPAHKDKFYFQKEFLLNVQNAYALTMLMCLMVQLCNCVFYYHCTNLVLFPIIFNYYIVADLFLCEPDIYIHHVLSFIILYIYNNNYEIIKDIYSIAIAFGMTEISTVFLTFRAILRNYKRAHPYITMVYNINDKIFVITFFYTRIYLYFFKLLCNEDMHKATMQFTLIEYHFFNKCLYLLYGLNLYWGYLIVRTIVKSLKLH
jgi:hypothetical protein